MNSIDEKARQLHSRWILEAARNGFHKPIHCSVQGPMSEERRMWECRCLKCTNDFCAYGDLPESSKQHYQRQAIQELTRRQ